MNKHRSKKGKKHTCICGWLSVLFLSIAALLLLYASPTLWSPFEKVEAYTINKGQTIMVNVETVKPAKTYVEYSTSGIYMNATEVTEGYADMHRFAVAEVLPNKKHFVRAVAITEDGQQYVSN